MFFLVTALILVGHLESWSGFETVGGYVLAFAAQCQANPVDLDVVKGDRANALIGEGFSRSEVGGR